MTHRINQFPPIADHDLLEILQSLRADFDTKFIATAKTRRETISEILKAKPQLSRDYVTGCVDTMLLKAATSPASPIEVRANDYTYSGWIVSRFEKRRGGIRFVVEDENGRLFIHNAKQLGLKE